MLMEDEAVVNVSLMYLSESLLEWYSSSFLFFFFLGDLVLPRRLAPGRVRASDRVHCWRPKGGGVGLVCVGRARLCWRRGR